MKEQNRSCSTCGKVLPGRAIETLPKEIQDEIKEAAALANRGE